VVLDAARFFVDYSWRVHGATDHARVDFARHGHAVHRGEEDMSVSEAVLESGEMVEVFGHCSWEHHPDSRHGTYRVAPKVLVVRARDGRDLLVGALKRTWLSWLSSRFVRMVLNG
jgi:hypothetical protein